MEVQLKSFDQLNISTMTIMCYCNFKIDTTNLFNLLPITPPSDKINMDFSNLKKKDIDKIKLYYNYREIINVSTKTRFRGLLLRRPKKKNCTICNPTKDKKVKKSIIEIFDSSTNCIMYKCNTCNQTYNPSDVKKINHFLNQMTIVMSLGVGKTPINIKMFHSGIFTITGCTEQDDAIEVMIILFKDIIPKLEKEHSIKLTTLKKGFDKSRSDLAISQAPQSGDFEPKRFIFEVVMRNYDFKLGFILNRSVLNNIMSNSKYDAYIKLSKYIPTDDTNVKIKMISQKLKGDEYETLILNDDDDSIDIKIIKENITLNPLYKPKKKVKEELDTFIVFSSSATIFSGKNVKSMERNYNIFIDIIKNHKNEIEEK